MTQAPNFLPGQSVRWKNQQMLIVDCQDMDTVIVQEPGKMRVQRAPVAELLPDVRIVAEAFIPPDLIKISEKAWQHALGQLKALEPLLAMDPAKRTLADVKAVADAQGKHPATIYRWLDEYSRTKRVSAFLRKARSDQGTARIPEKLEKIIQQAIKDKYRTAEQPDIAAVLKEVALKCREGKLKAPHDNTVRWRISMVSGGSVQMPPESTKDMQGMGYQSLSGSSQVPHGCYVDVGPDERPDACVMDSGNFDDCVMAGRLHVYGKDKTACEHWQQIKPQMTQDESTQLGRFRAEMEDTQRRMADLAANFLQLGAFEDAAKCAMKADTLKWVVGRIPSG